MGTYKPTSWDQYMGQDVNPSDYISFCEVEEDILRSDVQSMGELYQLAQEDIDAQYEAMRAEVQALIDNDENAQEALKQEERIAKKMGW